MRKILSLFLAICIFLSGCSLKNEAPLTNSAEEDSNNSIVDHTEIDSADDNVIIYADEPSFTMTSDPALTAYIEDTVFAGLTDELGSEDYLIEDVQAVYLSDEYIEELTYNSKENVFFGYTLKELDQEFGDQKYYFTLGEDGTTVVKALEKYDDSYERMIKNVAIGTGVIIVCVAVTYATGGTAAAPALKTVNYCFALAAKDAITLSKLGIPIGALAGAIAETIKEGGEVDLTKLLKSSLLGASEGFKWGAIIGALVGGATGGLSKYRTAKATAEAIAKQLADPNVPMWRKAELRALQKFGGEEQVSYLAGKIVEKGTPGATVPDVVHTVNGIKEAVEVKYYNLQSPQSLETLFRELRREVQSRVVNLPEGYVQRIVLDVTDRGFSKELVDSVATKIVEVLKDIYPDIPVTIVGL